MSRNFFPVVMAIGVGVFTGYYTFQPTFQQMSVEKAQVPPQSQLAKGSSPNEDSAPAGSTAGNPKHAAESSK
ncbi:hypothetical protein POX_a01248 [Penicillium oxalicum]|uniref:hypothetical protein n=1 Tax=Penicillium oxalicum TaxID=69781 RepID=UPI0020B7B365|nr:hypothetical protein POX_a01248 [Penicillium oxalicum]KAI2794649.1 hypothetical protein POX_a01248 [Penicillium oxalicum]